ncbi:MAG TPA: hypothetical protein DCE44_01035, partial [Verrucomicrobiales bacterium]|nr:hypothetical protein [Verrucomicrobiales bacterium]
LVHELEQQVAASAGKPTRPPPWFEACVASLRQRLNLTVRDLLEYHPRDLERYRHLLDRLVGETSLDDYWAVYEGGFVKAVPDWCNRMQARIRALLGVGPDSADDDFVAAIAARRQKEVPLENPGEKSGGQRQNSIGDSTRGEFGT